MNIAESLNCAKWINQQSFLKLNEEKSFSDFLKNLIPINVEILKEKEKASKNVE